MSSVILQKYLVIVRFFKLTLIPNLNKHQLSIYILYPLEGFSATSYSTHLKLQIFEENIFVKTITERKSNYKVVIISFSII
jgi:hypothetical protein